MPIPLLRIQWPRRPTIGELNVVAAGRQARDLVCAFSICHLSRGTANEDRRPTAEVTRVGRADAYALERTTRFTGDLAGDRSCRLQDSVDAGRRARRKIEHLGGGSIWFVGVPLIRVPTATTPEVELILTRCQIPDRVAAPASGEGQPDLAALLLARGKDTDPGKPAALSIGHPTAYGDSWLHHWIDDLACADSQ